MPRLIVPSIGGGTKLILTLLTGEGGGVCSGVGEGIIWSGEIEAEGDSPAVGEGVGEGVGVGGSCASATDKMAIVNARVSLVIMSSGVETSLTV